MKTIGKDIPYRMAKKDISKYIKEQKIQIQDEHGDYYVVTPSRIDTKETKRLNAELGLHKVNKYGKKMNHLKSNQ